MSKNVNVNGTEYTGVSQVQLNTTDGATALFKDVDEITTPSGTKSITANGTYDVSDFASAEVNVPSEGGGFEIDTAETLLCTVETEDLMGNILAAHPITPKYQNELLIITVRGENAPTQGKHTLRSQFWCINGTAVSALNGYVNNALVAPDTVKPFYGSGSEENNGYTSGISTAYTSIGSDGALSINTNYAYYVAAGNTVSYYEIPLDLTVPTIDTTLRASE